MPVSDDKKQRPEQRPVLTPQAEADRLARLEREAAALRANLRRRKEQIRLRASEKPSSLD